MRSAFRQNLIGTSSIGDEDILLPDDPAIFDAILGRTETRKLTHKGIELDGLLYNSPELSDLRKRYGEKLTVELRIDDSNIGEIIVVCPKTGDLYRVSALHSDYAAGLSPMAAPGLQELLAQGIQQE